MSTFGSIVYDFGGIALRLFALIIVIGQICFAVSAFLRRHGMLYRIAAVIQLAAGSFWFFVLLDGSFNKDYVIRPRTYIALVDIIFDSPWLIVLAVNTALAAVCCISLLSERRYRRTHLSRIAVKETVDMLPVGLCFARGDGSIALKNQQMEQLCAAICGGSLLDAGAFLQAIKSLGEAQEQAWIVPLPDGRAVLFREERIAVDGAPFTQISAYDVSEQYHITAELKEKNKKLKELQARMKTYGAQAAKLSMNEELLRARVTVHDEMGHLLLSGKNYLDHPADTDEEKLIEAERYVHLMLMHEGEEQEHEGAGTIERALDAARALGVSVRVIGDIPTEGTACELTARAVRECAANAVKHAGGGSMTVTIEPADGRTRVRLSTGGRPPEGPITESGGLLNLRRSTESAGGTMTVTCDPQVTVTLTI